MKWANDIEELEKSIVMILGDEPFFKLFPERKKFTLAAYLRNFVPFILLFIMDIFSFPLVAELNDKTFTVSA